MCPQAEHVHIPDPPTWPPVTANDIIAVAEFLQRAPFPSTRCSGRPRRRHSLVTFSRGCAVSATGETAGIGPAVNVAPGRFHARFHESVPVTGCFLGWSNGA